MQPYEIIIIICGIFFVIFCIIGIVICNLLTNRVVKRIADYKLAEKYSQEGDKEKALYYYRLWETESNKRWWEF